MFYVNEQGVGGELEKKKNWMLRQVELYKSRFLKFLFMQFSHSFNIIVQFNTVHNKYSREKILNFQKSLSRVKALSFKMLQKVLSLTRCA